VRPIYRTGVPLPSRCCILYIFSKNISTEYFKHAAHSPFFSSKCRLFHNATFFGSCMIHILHTGVLKFNVKFWCQRLKYNSTEQNSTLHVMEGRANSAWSTCGTYKPLFLKTHWWWYLGAEKCRSCHLIWRVFYDLFYCILVSELCWVLKMWL